MDPACDRTFTVAVGAREDVVKEMAVGRVIENVVWGRGGGGGGVAFVEVFDVDVSPDERLAVLNNRPCGRDLPGVVGVAGSCAALGGSSGIQFLKITMQLEVAIKTFLNTRMISFTELRHRETIIHYVIPTNSHMMLLNQTYFAFVKHKNLLRNWS